MAYEQMPPTELDFEPTEVRSPDEFMPERRPWIAPQIARRVAGGILATQALSGCLSVPTDKQVGEANTVAGFTTTTDSPEATTAPSTTEAPASEHPLKTDPAQAPSTTTIYVTTEAPPVTVFVTPTPEPRAPDSEGSQDNSTIANPPVDNNGNEDNTDLGVVPNISGMQPGTCGIGGEQGDPALEGMTAPNCEAPAPVLVAGEVFPICQLVGDEIVLGDSEVHFDWIKWQNQFGNMYFSPAIYLRGAPTTLDSCD
jgi:hypothetical protein